jgi:hypothetical protein
MLLNMLCLLFLRVSTLSATLAGGPRTVPQVQANSTILAWGVEKRQTWEVGSGGFCSNGLK